jgi:hypothetical protein
MLKPGDVIPAFQSVMVSALNVRRSAQGLRPVQAFESGEVIACDWQPGQTFVKAA